MKKKTIFILAALILLTVVTVLVVRSQKEENRDSGKQQPQTSQSKNEEPADATQSWKQYTQESKAFSFKTFQITYNQKAEYPNSVQDFETLVTQTLSFKAD